MFFNIKFAFEFIFFVYVLSAVNSKTTDGIETEMKMYNGTSAKRHRYLKYVVQVIYLDSFCGGAILTPKAILTAAHCVTRDGARPFKKEDISKSFVCASSLPITCDSPTTQRRKVQNVLMHENYTKGRKGNDIAIFTLRKALVEDGNTVQRIKLPTRPTLPGTVCTVIGWGDVSCKEDAYEFPEEASYTTQTLLSKSNCKKTFPFPIRPGQLCAIDLSNNTLLCSGDSGSPLMCDGNLVGILSMGTFKNDAPELYTAVLYFRNWILNTIERENFQIRNFGARVRAVDLCIMLFLPLVFKILCKFF